MVSNSYNLLITECADNNGGCSDVCVETFSGFTCECSDPGFEVGPDEVTCVGEYRLKYDV